jgi:hypothetical protein
MDEDRVEFTLDGWYVEWGPFIERRRGVVLTHTEENALVHDERENEVIELPITTRFVKIKRASNKATNDIMDNIEKGIIKLRNSKDKDLALMIRTIIKGLEDKDINPTKAILKSIHKNSSMPKKKSPKKSPKDIVVYKYTGKFEKEVIEDNYSDDFEVESSDGDGKSGSENSSEDEEEEDGDDSDDDDSDSEEDSEEEDADEGSESEEDEGEEDEDSDEEDSDEDDDMVELKVFVEPYQDIRGFSLRREKIISSTMRILEKDYGSRPKLYYADADGDTILLMGKTDLKYALRVHDKMVSKEKDGSEGGKSSSRLLKLVARFTNENVAETGKVLSNKKQISKSVDGSIFNTVVAGEPANSVEFFSSNASDHRLFSNFNNDLVQQSTIDTYRGNGSNEMIWQKGEVVGSGSFGQVYSGLNLSTGMLLAVKEVSLGLSKKSVEQAQSLQYEIEILSKLEHRNIIKYLGGKIGII